MPKIKTHRGAAKRFKKTAKGKIKAKHSYHSHLLGKKDRKRKRKLRKAKTDLHPADIKKISKLMPYD